MENIKFLFHIPSPDKPTRTALQKVRRWKFETEEHSLKDYKMNIRFCSGFYINNMLGWVEQIFRLAKHLVVGATTELLTQ